MGEIPASEKPEISIEHKEVFVARIRELLPDLIPSIISSDRIIKLVATQHPDMPEDEIRRGLDEEGVVGGEAFIIMNSEVTHELDGEVITLSHEETSSGSTETKARVSRDHVSTDERLSLSSSTTYIVANNEALVRSSFFLSLRGSPTTADQLRKIFAEEYLQPVLDIHQELSSAPSRKVFDESNYHDIMRKLLELSDETVQLPQY